MRLRIRRRSGERFTPFTPRQRLLVALLAVGTTLVIGVAMLSPHVEFLRAKLRQAGADKPACAPGQSSGCVGGTMGVIMVAPPQAPPSPPPAPASR